MTFFVAAIWVIIAVFLAIDAPKHNMNPWLWGILGFLFGLIPLGIYLIQTNRKTLGILAVVFGALAWFGVL